MSPFVWIALGFMFVYVLVSLIGLRRAPTKQGAWLGIDTFWPGMRLLRDWLHARRPRKH